MTAGSLIIGLGAGIACLGIARLIARSIARIEFAIDDALSDPDLIEPIEGIAWGDVPIIPKEAKAATREVSSAGGEQLQRAAASTQGMVALHSEGGF